jgi:hypothetical protein
LNGTVGASTANTGNFTTLTTSSTVTVNGGTANGVTYLNGSKVLTSGSELTFDGSTFAVSTATGVVRVASSTGTNGAYLYATNTGGDFYFGRDNSTGTTFSTGSAYSAILYSAGAYPMVFFTNATEKMRLDSSGNLGLGVTPSAWASGTKAFDVGTGSSLFNPGSSTLTWLMTNSYNNGTNFIYKNTGAAGYYSLGAAHSWHTAASGTAGNTISFTQAMTLDASGNLGVGVTNPASFVAGGGYTGVAINGSTGSSIALNASGSNVGLLFASTSNNLFLTNQTASGAVIFAAGSGNERARIDSSGNLLVGATTGTNIGGLSQKFSTFTSSNSQFIAGLLHTASSGTCYGLGISYTSNAPNAVGSDFINCGDNVATRFAVYSNGGIANYATNNVILSDRREKTNFAPATSYLEKICAIPVQTFNYIDQNLETDDGLNLGVVAQDVQAIAPELVTETDWGTKENPKMRFSIYQTDLQYAVMKALQELKAEFDAYKASHP